VVVVVTALQSAASPFSVNSNNNNYYNNNYDYNYNGAAATTIYVSAPILKFSV
jgi:hypothetical protein